MRETRHSIAAFAAVFLPLTIAGCGGGSEPPAAETAETNAPVEAAPAESVASADEVDVGAAIDAVLAGEHRTDEERARDQYRNPKETLLFFGIEPDMHVVEIWPGGGWYTKVIAPIVAESGRYYAASWDPNLESEYVQRGLAAYADMLAAHPDAYGNVEMTALAKPPTELAIAPPGSVDMVVTFRSLHGWMRSGWAKEAFESMYAALKPGGVLGIVQHRAPADTDQDPEARSGYVREDYAVELIESVGFELVESSEINANPADTKDYEGGVWTLPPTFAKGDEDREKYAAIGESDRFTLKFVKPAT